MFRELAPDKLVEVAFVCMQVARLIGVLQHEIADRLCRDVAHMLGANLVTTLRQGQDRALLLV